MVTKTNPTTKLILKVYKTAEKDPKSTLQRTFAHVNPELSDAALSSIGRKLAALQSHDLLSVSRSDTAELAE